MAKPEAKNLCPDCLPEGQSVELRITLEQHADWYGTIRYSRCPKCKGRFVACSNWERSWGAIAAVREGEFTNTITQVRDMLQPIVDGEIERGHCVGGREAYGAVPGKRKVKLVDAARIAKSAIARINKAINEFESVWEPEA